MLESYLKQIPLSLTTQALLLGLTVGLVTYYTFGKKKYKLPPGPWAPPLIGHIIAINWSTPLYRQLFDWSKKYGPAMTLYMGPVRCVVLNDVETVNEALVKKGADYAGRFKSFSIEKLTSGYKDIAFADVSPTWKHLRKIALQGLRQYLYGSKLEEKVFESTSKVMRRLKEEEGKPIDIQKYVGLLVCNVFHGVCFNKSFDIDDKYFLKLLDMFETTNSEFGNGFWEDIIPPLRKCPTSKFKRLTKIFANFLDFIRNEFETHKANFSEDDMKDFADYLIHARRQAILEGPEIENIITDEHLVHTCSDIYSAGIDTTRQTIIWTIMLLVAHPEIQKKVQAELDQVIDAGQAPTLNDREKMPYTEAVLHESMRLCTIAPLGLPHATRCDTTLGEDEIPKGTMVMVNHWALHNDPEHWKDPEIFRPERLLDADGKLAPKTMSWLPFSAGRRNCLGETIARPEMHLMLAILLRNFTFRSPEGKTIDLTPEGSLVFLPRKSEMIAEERK
ncbi:steroid 17-alpha-hydroxylase/17,20 lyase isoform X3 [Patella vulgata]|uniref:steroid 17-alpha-hydroxylase/17,20 lyase isoform X3 n=1 Tax=Patella vulgata TaxID=6465 RepID=UPI0024A8AC46|nr:steroid 17-alpha-hydroxylase/17,20 lyase isoform X3 [Patella vulgata]